MGGTETERSKRSAKGACDGAQRDTQRSGRLQFRGSRRRGRAADKWGEGRTDARMRGQQHGQREEPGVGLYRDCEGGMRLQDSLGGSGGWGPGTASVREGTVKLREKDQHVNK